MTPTVKFTLARVGLFAVVALVLWPTPLDPLVKLMIALVVSTVLQFFVLKRWRAEMIDHIDKSVARRREGKERLRAALAGEEDEPVNG